jgi:methylenetetrahydrofolate dehydrogenase (NADP+)/methenyltetrahydrofolate cyclohydrolase
MPAHIIDGDAVAARITSELQKTVEALKARGATPRLAALIATDNRGARIYASNQAKTCEKIGIEYTLVEMPPTSTEADLMAGVQKLNDDKSVSGIIIQMPVPDGVNARKLQMMVHPLKDVEGITPANEGRVVHAPQPFLRKPAPGDKDYDQWLEKSLGWPLPAPAPCTPCGAMMLIRSLNVDLYGKEAVVVGHSEIVGKPMGLLLVAHFCTTTWCHVATRDLAAHVRRADIVCVAVGRAGLVKGDMIKPGAIVIDIGINRIQEIGPDGNPVLDEKGRPKMKTVGDVEFDKAREVAAYITPVPGGVGPMTVAMLLRNTVEAAKAQAALK